MGELIAGVDVLRSSTRAHVCLVHHEGKDSAKGMRGHSALLGAVDTAIAISTDKGDARIGVARLTKQKEDEGGRFQKFTLQSVALDRCDEDGEPIKSAVTIPATGSLVFEDETLTSRQNAALQILEELMRERFADNIDDGAPPRVWIGLAKWKTALENADWPDGRKQASKLRRTSGGQPLNAIGSGAGQQADKARTMETFYRYFRRLRQELVKKQIIEVEGEAVAFAKQLS